jgi:hypothetical protein
MIHFYIRSLSPSSEEKLLHVSISDPIPSSSWIGSYECSYKIEETSISGTVTAGDPFIAIRYACHAVRVSIAYRFNRPKFLNSKNEEIDISYDEIL